MVREIFRRTRRLAVRGAETQQDSQEERELHASALVLLRNALNDPRAEFREGQWEAIRDLVLGRQRLLLVQRTGWGKTLVYFIAAALLRRRGSGTTLLISPLLSLMRNQLLAADRMGIRAATINSTNNDDWWRVEQRAIRGELDVLLISPERLANNRFRQKTLAEMADGIGMFVVDEAHCISDWGHDFRPDYQRIVGVLRLLPRNVPVLATTATANDRVIADIESQLGSRLRTSRGPLVRRSLRLQTISMPSQAARMAWLVEQIPDLPGSGIIYTLTIRDANLLSAWLQANGIDARAYSARLDNPTREELEHLLLKNEVKVLVSTVALGMGFDKPDLGFVIHFQRPGSVVHYYQQIGRAGRALDNAYAVLLHGSEDDDIINHFINQAFPAEAHAQAIFDALSEAEYGLSASELEQQVNATPGQIEHALKILSLETPAPIQQLDRRWYANPVRFRFDRERVERITELRQDELRQMNEYVHGERCLMEFLLDELNDPSTAPCGRCSVCTGSPLLPEDVSLELGRQAVVYLRRNAIPIYPRREWPVAKRGVVRWSDIPENRQAEVGRALCYWGDSGWGTFVRRGKVNFGWFEDELVNAVTAMVRVRWTPQPGPAWVTCVPSLRHPELVPDIAKRIAERLELPFVACIRKVRETEPQKEMQNSHQQAANLAGAFEIDRSLVRRDPVFLIDDMVDSRWTFTALAGLLRQAGSGPVFPLALADSRGN